MLKVLIAGGGTGGHLFPGVALAEEITTRARGNEVLFVGTKRGIEARVLPGLGFPLELLEVEGLKGKGLFARARGVSRLPVALLRSFRILSRFRPDVAVGVGGYASGPMMLAAWMAGVPTAILEQNAVPGVTNKILGRFVGAVFVMFEVSRTHFPAARVQVLGNPVRRGILDNFLAARAVRGPRFRLLVLGGSQGASGLNRRVLDAMEALSDRRGELTVLHQTGARDEADVRAGYERLGVDADVRAFVEDMSAAYRDADLVVCRAGATTIAELMVAKKAAILVPFPHAADNHQEHNAQALVDAGAAVLLREPELTGPVLADAVRALLDDPDRLAAMERASGLAGRPEAAREIVDACVELIGRRR